MTRYEKDVSPMNMHRKKVIRTFLLWGVMLSFFWGGYQEWRFNQGIIYNGVTTVGSIIERTRCTSSSRPPYQTGTCARAQYHDDKNNQYIIALPFSKTDYIYYSEATIVYERDRPDYARVVKLDRQEVNIDGFHTIWWTVCVILLLVVGLLHLVIVMPPSDKKK